MKQPQKPKWKRWLMAGAATLGIAGFGGGMMTTNLPVIPQDNNQTQSTTIFSQTNDPFGVADTFNRQSGYNQLRLAQDANDAAILNDIAALQRAIDNGYDLHANQDSVLRTAVTFESYDVVKYAISNGGDVNANSGDALEKAAIWGKLGMIQLLVENGADVNVNNSGPLYWAVLAGNNDVAQYLVDHGSKITPDMLNLHTARINGKMANILQQGSANQGNGFLGVPYALPPFDPGV